MTPAPAIKAEAPAIKGWCPTLLAPMLSGDGWLARVKPSASTLAAAEARSIAEAARRHGNGHIDLTARANLQIRGLTPRSAALFAACIIDQGLAHANPARETIRNVMASPLGANDPTAAFDSHAAARDIETMLVAEPALQALPTKFGFLVDGGGALPLENVTADIMVRANGSACTVQLDGGTCAALCSRHRLAETVKDLALAFLRLASDRCEPHRRMRALVLALGEEAIFTEAGLAPFPRPSTSAAEVRRAVGSISYGGQDEGAFGVGLPFGRIEAEALTELAGLAERRGDGTLRTTPWRALLLPGISSFNISILTDEIHALGLIANPADPRLNIFACVGAPSCRSASVAARDDASRIAASLGPMRGETIHVSGCAKSCAHRGPAALTLIGRDGRYDLIRHGGAGDAPSLTGLSLDDAIALLAAAKGNRP